MKEKYIRTYGNNYELPSPNNNELMSLFYRRCKENNIVCDNDKIFEYLHTFEEKQCGKQLSLFD